MNHRKGDGNNETRIAEGRTNGPATSSSGVPLVELISEGAAQKSGCSGRRYLVYREVKDK